MSYARFVEQREQQVLRLRARPRDGERLPRQVLRRRDMEPRAVKRRPKEYDRLSRPRNMMQAELRASIGALSSG